MPYFLVLYISKVNLPKDKDDMSTFLKSGSPKSIPLAPQRPEPGLGKPKPGPERPGPGLSLGSGGLGQLGDPDLKKVDISS